MRVTHPFHPLAGLQLVCVGERYTRYGTRLLLRVDEDHVCSVARPWTDVVAPDPEVVIGKGRALLRVADLLELADLVSRLVGREDRTWSRKANHAADVKQTTPLVAPQLCAEASNGASTRESGGAFVLDSGPWNGVIGMTEEREIACQDLATAQTPRPQHSSRRAR